MKTSRKLSLLLVAVLVVSLALSACTSAPANTSSGAAAPTSSGTGTASTDAAAPVEIRAAWWGGTERNAVYQAIIDRFMEAYPHVTVISEPADWGSYWDKLAIQVAGGNAPDMMGMSGGNMGEYIGRDAIAPLGKYVADGTIDLSQWEDGVVQTGVRNGESYLIPMGVTFRSCYINLGVLKDLGVTVPCFDWTWDDVKSIGLEVRAAQQARGNNSWFFQNVSGDVGVFNFFARQYGKETYNEDGSLGVDAETVEKWWTMWKEFIDLGVCVDVETGIEYESATMEDGLLAQDRILTDLNAANQFAGYCATFPDKELALIRFPSTAGGIDMEYAEGSFFSVYNNTTDEKKLASAQLINFWVNDERGLELFLIDQGVPGNIAMLDTAVMPNLNDAQNAFVEYVAKVSPLAGNPAPIPPLGGEECSAEFEHLNENVMFGVMTPADAAAEFIKNATDILAKAAA